VRKFLDKEWVPEYAATIVGRWRRSLRAGKQDDHYDSSGNLKKRRMNGPDISSSTCSCVQIEGVPEDMDIWKKQAKYLLEKIRPLTEKVRCE